MATSRTVDRDLLVFSIWAVLGFLGLAFLLEGLTRDSYLVSLIGIAVIVIAFVAHIIVNSVFSCGFTNGEVALGIGSFGVIVFVFIAGWFGGYMSMADFLSGITLFAVLTAGLFAYLSTRHGLRGAFSQFHIKPDHDGESGR